MWALIKAKLTGQELIPLVAVEVVPSDSRRVLSANSVPGTLCGLLRLLLTVSQIREAPLSPPFYR